ncbi:C40 family peptidase [bacterium]|nr:C40 family peptidase [bacterium]MBU1635645.1 C40 family peptidase [bacterium]MBU1872375.1 C40 family peptidase [bacterium]
MLIRKKNLNVYLLILIVFTQLLLADTTDVFNRVNEISQTIKKQYCPDKRTSVWTVTPQLINNQYVLTGETDNKTARSKFYQQINRAFPDIEFDKNMQLLPDDVMNGTIFAVPKNSIAILRRRPSVTEEMVSQSLRGLPLDILKHKRGFYYVRTDDGYLGWVSDDRVHEGDKTFKEDWMSAPKVVYIDLEGMVFSKASEKSQPVSDVVMGNRFRLIKQGRKWTKVGYPDGREGYIFSKSLEKLDDYLNRPLDFDKIIKTAKSLNGRPYMWGAASPKQLDCSGFTQTVFRQHGYILQRDASMQVFEGSAVDTTNFPENLKPGDLIFFSPYPDRITHVGLYIGDYEFIHSSGRVRIDSFNPDDPHYNNYRRRGIQAVRRISK